MKKSIETVKLQDESEAQLESFILKVLAKHMEKSSRRTPDNHHIFTMSPSEVHQILNPAIEEPNNGQT